MSLDSLEEKTSGEKGWGGAREGGGRPKGSKNKATIENQIINDAIRERVLRGHDALINAQFTLAKGVSMLYMIKTLKNGQKLKPELITDQATIEAFLNDELNDPGDEEYFYITTEKPDNKAIDSLIDRTVGKSVNRTALTDPSGEHSMPIPIISLNTTDAIPGDNSNEESQEPQG